MQTRKLWISVVRIADMYPLHSSRSLSLAANNLEPGTCYGYGDTRKDAVSAAMLEAAVFRMNGNG